MSLHYESKKKKEAEIIKEGIIVFLKMRNESYTNRAYISRDEEKEADIGDAVKN